jgi:hypothetical protein
MKTGTATRGIAVAICATILVAQAAVAGPGRGPISLPRAAPSSSRRPELPSLAQAQLDSTASTVESVRRAMGADSFLLRTDRYLKLAGSSSPAPALPAPSSAEVQSLAKLPASVVGPIAGLLAATRRAIDIVGPLAPRSSRQLQRSVFELQQLRVPRHVRRGQLPFTTGGGSLSAISGSRTGVKHPTVLPGTATAARLIALALDTYLPELETNKAPAEQSATAQGCDVLDDTPLLCVGSTADNTYTENEALLIDLGGNDVYHNTAGGAPFRIPQEETLAMTISVNVDLGRGDDTYAYTGDCSKGCRDYIGGTDLYGQGPALVAQGASFALSGCWGVLVDDGGDDSYSAVAEGSAPYIDSNGIGVVADGHFQGTGGALFDLGGNDTYSASVRMDAQPYYSTLQGQGFDGVLVDVGLGNDHYLLDGGTRSQPGDYFSPLVGGAYYPAATYVEGQGAAGLNAGVLFDDGGADSFDARGAASWLPSLAPDVLLQPEAEATTFLDGYHHPYWYGGAPRSLVDAQGSCMYAACSSFLLEGSGPTTYSVEATGTGITVLDADGQGWAGFGGLAALDDLGGNDQYSLSGRVSHEASLTWSDQCDGSGRAACDAAAAVLDQAYGSDVAVRGQGAELDLEGGSALLHDHGGDDGYTAADSYELSASIQDQRSASPSGPAATVWPGEGMNAGQLLVQGAIHGQTPFNTPGTAFLVDDAGTDSYTATYEKHVLAAVTGSHAPGESHLRVVATEGDLATVAAQGAAFNLGGASVLGALIDLAGTGDTFDARSSLSADTNAPGGGLVRAYPFPSFQGSGYGGGYGVLEVLGDSPRISASPSQVVCPSSPGARGFGSWAECAGMSATDANNVPVDRYGYGLGHAESAAGRAPSLAITGAPHDIDASDGARFPATALLKGPDGQAIAGALVHFFIQLSDPSHFVTGAWQTRWCVDAITGPDGLATAMMPLDDLAYEVNSYGGHPSFRVFATYDGEAGIYPAHAARSIDVTTPSS